MVAIGVIGCGYNYLSIMLINHHGSFRSFAVQHQESSRLAHDGQVGINRMNFSTKIKN
jgi:hypothetical protein